MTWELYTTVMGSKESIAVHHLGKRLFRFSHRALVTESNVDGEYSSTKCGEVLKLAVHIAQTGSLE